MSGERATSEIKRHGSSGDGDSGGSGGGGAGWMAAAGRVATVVAPGSVRMAAGGDFASIRGFSACFAIGIFETAW